MNLIDKYVAKNILQALGLVIIILAGLQIFILLVGQIDSISKGQYHLLKAFEYVLLATPAEMYSFFPMASLLGCLIGLGQMANARELLVMRASGVSIMQVLGALTKASIVVILVVTLLGETIAPKLALMANDLKLDALSQGQSVRTALGLWVRYQNNFIYIGEVVGQNRLNDVMQFRFDDKHRINLIRKAQSIDFIAGRWQANEVEETQFFANTTQSNKAKTQPWDVALNQTILSTSNQSPDEMTLSELYHYITAKKALHQPVSAETLMFWQRLIAPLTIWVMMLLAIPFIFGPLRGSTMGAKLLLGAAFGFGFYLLNRFLGPFVAVYQLPPMLMAFLPTVVFGVIGAILMKRAR